MNSTYLDFLLFVLLGLFCIDYVSPVSISAYAELSSSINVSSDSYVDQDLPEKNFGSESNLAIGWTNSLQNETPIVKQVLSYLKFDLDEFPQSNEETITTVDAVYLDISINETWWLENNKHSLTIYPCFENYWLEEELTWDTRPCQDYLENGVRYDLDVPYIPKDNPIDITEMIMNARNQNLSEITLIVSGCSTDKGRIDCQKNPGLVWIQSLENMDQNTNQIPKLDVRYTAEQKTVTTFELMVFILAVVVIIVSIILFIQYIRRGQPFRRWRIRKQKTSKF